MAGLALIAVLIGVGRYLLNPIFRIVAGSRAPGVLAAPALMVVLGSALLMDMTGLSMALSAFVAGVSLAGAEYRHQVESAIEPDKGLLLGLFFMAVGLGVNLGLLVAEPLQVLARVAGLVIVKALVATLALRLAGQEMGNAFCIALLLSQAGEFAFILLANSGSVGVLAGDSVELLTLVVALSMATTPLLVVLQQRLLDARKPRTEANYNSIDVDVDGEAAAVIIAGCGRFGQIVGRVLRMRGIVFTALEISADHVDVVRRIGNRVYYGDAARLDLLRAARADQARVLVVAVDDVEASLRITELARRQFPRLKVMARARHRQHAHALRDLGVQLIVRETLHSALQVSRQLLIAMGDSAEASPRAVELFEAHNDASLNHQFALRNSESVLIQSSRQAADELERLFPDDTPTANGAERKPAG